MKKKQILILKVSLNDNSFDYIRVHEDDEPDILAQSFIEKHALSPRKKPFLENMIEKQIDVIVERDLKAIRNSIATNRSQTPLIRYQAHPQTYKAAKPVKSSALISQTKTDLLLKQKKEEKINSLFNMLQPGRDQKISFGIIQKLDLESPVFQVIKPVLDNIVEKKQVIGLKEFSREVLKALEKLSESEINMFLSSSNKNIHCYQPKIRRFHQILN